MSKSKVFPRNDCIIWVRGVVDETDPINADGSPKWINTATGTWEMRTAEYPAGSQVSSGVVIPTGSQGTYIIELNHSIAFAVDNDYYAHVVMTTPNGHVIDVDQPVASITRTGHTDRT